MESKNKRISEDQLKEIIREEIKKLLNEQVPLNPVRSAIAKFADNIGASVLNKRVEDIKDSNVYLYPDQISRKALHDIMAKIREYERTPAALKAFKKELQKTCLQISQVIRSKYAREVQKLRNEHLIETALSNKPFAQITAELYAMFISMRYIEFEDLSRSKDLTYKKFIQELPKFLSKIESDTSSTRV